MTIRQLADTAGCDITTAKRIGKMIYPNVKSIGRGIALEYTREQSTEIMKKLPKKNFVSDPNIGQIPQDNIGQMTQVMTFMVQMQKQQQEFMSAVLERLEGNIKTKEKQKQIAPPVDPKKALKRVVDTYAVNKMDSDFSGAYHKLYDEIYDRIGRDVYRCAKNRKISGLKYMEQEEILGLAMAIAIEVMGE